MAAKENWTGLIQNPYNHLGIFHWSIKPWYSGDVLFRGFTATFIQPLWKQNKCDFTEKSFFPSVQVLCYEVKPGWSWRQATNTVHNEYMLRLYNEVLNGCVTKRALHWQINHSSWVSDLLQATCAKTCQEKAWYDKHLIWAFTLFIIATCLYYSVNMLKNMEIYIYIEIYKKFDKTLSRPWLQRPPPRLFHSPIIGLLPFGKLLKNFLSIFVLCRTSTKMDE